MHGIPSELYFNNEPMILSLSRNDPHRGGSSLQDKLEKLLDDERLRRRTYKRKKRRTYRKGRGSRRKRRRRRSTRKKCRKKKKCKGCYLF